MKYLHVLGLALVLLMSVTACQSSDAVDRIREAGVLRVAMDPSLEPFEFVDGNGQPVGFDVDLARQIGARIGVEIQFVATSYDGLYDALTAQKADIIISALYPDPARTQAFAFSPPYFQAGDMLIVRKDSTINDVNGLAGKQVMVVYGTEAHLIAEQWVETLSPPVTLLPGDAPETIIAVLASGYADAALVDNVSARLHVTADTGLRIVGSPVNDNPYVIAARVEDKALIEAIGQIIEEMNQDGTIEQLFQRWLSEK